MGTFRERDRMKHNVRSAMPPLRQKRRVKIPPAQAMRCRVMSASGEYYDYDEVLRDLSINKVHPDGHVFESRTKANGAIFRTIKRWLYEGITWEEKQFFLENVE